MDDLTEYKRLLCHTMTVMDFTSTVDSFTGGKSERVWTAVAEGQPCRLSGSPGRIQQLAGRQAASQELLLHTLYGGLKAGMRLTIGQPQFAGKLYEVGEPYPVYGESDLHHYEVVVRLIDSTTARPIEEI